MDVDTEQDFSTAVGGTEENDAPEETITHAQKLPTLKVNSNDLSWLKEQKASKDSVLIQEEMSGEMVRISTHSKKVSQFYVPPVDTNEDVEDPEEGKSLFSPAPEVVAATVAVRKDSEETKDSGSVSGTEGRGPQNFELYCECGNLCEGENSLCRKCQEKQKPVEFSGHLYAQVYSGLKLCWFRLLNKELYCKLATKT